jgi:16S rRNA processing protein RimM
MARRGQPLAFPSGGEAESRQRPGEGGIPTSPASSALPPSPQPSLIKGEGDRLVLLGEFGRAHGLKGEVRLKSFAEHPEAIARYSPLQDERGRSFALMQVRPAGGGSADMLVARVEGIATREAAEALNRVRLYAPRARLSAAADEDEFLAADLVGLRAETSSGEVLGTIVAVPNSGGGDLLEIAPPRGPTALLPFTRAFVPVIDVTGGRLIIEPPDDLFEPAPE